MDEETLHLTPIPLDHGPLSAEQARLVEVLLQHPFATPELRRQVELARVVSRCGCGCASVSFEVDPTAPPATWDAADSPTGRTDWVPLTAHGTDATGKSIEVTLHVIDGCIHELEIWSGAYGDFVLPHPDTLHLEERIPAKTRPQSDPAS